MGARTFNARIKKFKEDPLFQEEMLKHTDTYLDYIAAVLHGFSSPPYVACEKKVNYGGFAPEGFGTCDCIIINGEGEYSSGEHCRFCRAKALCRARADHL